MLGVLLVIVVAFFFGGEVGAQLGNHDAEDAVDGFLVGAVTSPDGDEVGIEADG